MLVCSGRAAVLFTGSRSLSFDRISSRLCVIAGLLVGVAASPIAAQQAETESPPVAAAQRTESQPVIDGRPDEATWQAASAMTGFIQREPNDGALASERTEVRVLYDSDAIYVGVWAYDSRADQIVPGEAIRDFEVTDADAVIMVFDTFKDEQNGFSVGLESDDDFFKWRVCFEGPPESLYEGGIFSAVLNVRLFKWRVCFEGLVESL